LVAAGPHAVAEVLDSQVRVVRVFVEPQAERRAAAILATAAAAGVPISKVGKDECDRLAGIRAQGVAAEIVFRFGDLGEILEAAQARAAYRGRPAGVDGSALLVFLDGIQDPHNLGAIVRTAEAAGAAGLVLPARHSATVSPAVMRTSAGAAAHLPICRVTNLARALENARRHGFWAVGLDYRSPRLLECGQAGAKTALVVGGEAEGLRRLVREGCDELVRLPMAGRVESLNASVAAAVAIYRVAGPVISVRETAALD